MEVRAADRRLPERGVPCGPRAPELVRQALGVERVLVDAGSGRGRAAALRERAQIERPAEGLADHVQLIVEHEQIARHAIGGVRGAEELERAHLEEAAEHLVHGDERGRHAAGGSEEAPPAQRELLRRLIGELGNARLDLALLECLRMREVFAVRHHLGRDWRAERLRLVGAHQSGKLALGQPGVFFA